MSAYDAIVVGAGHNGLVAACALAARGKRVAVVERSPEPGGLAATTEFHPGYRVPGILHDTRGVRPAVVKALGLERHGLELHAHGPDVLALAGDGRALALRGDRAAAARAIAAVSARDGERYLAWLAAVERLRPAVARLFDGPPVDVVHADRLPLQQLAGHGLALRRLGRRDLTELLRIPPMCVADWLGEWLESDFVKAALALPAIAGTWAGPWSPGTAANLLLYEATAGRGVAGGPAALVAALVGAARAASVDLRTGAEVRSIDVEEGGVAGVTLADGTSLSAPVVAASCDPRQTLLELLPRGAVTLRLEHRMRNFRCRGTTAHVALALDRRPAFTGAPDGTFEYARTGAHVDDLERAFDAVKYRRMSDVPALEIHLPADPSLAPEAHAVLGVLVHFAPHDIDGSWDDAQREVLADRVLAVLEGVAPGLAGTVVARRVWSPADLARELRLPDGHVHHGEHALDQLLVRPVPECFDHRTPVRGLYLAGSGSHPGGGLTCAPGWLAARAIAD